MTALVGDFFRRNVEEIVSDPVLRIYGVVLAFVHVLTFFYWRRGTPLQAVLPVGTTPICWPFFEECHRFRFLTATGVEVILWSYLGLALLAMVLFARRSAVGSVGAWRDLSMGGVTPLLSGTSALVCLWIGVNVWKWRPDLAMIPLWNRATSSSSASWAPGSRPWGVSWPAASAGASSRPTR